MTAGDAEADPEISIMVEQGSRGDAKAMSKGEFGHAMIGLSYGRYNLSTNRRERYAIQYGFYPSGGMVNKSGTLMMIGGATVPGELRDDYRHHYDVARRYKAKPGDVNKILRASETYADGGYGYFKRNCTTFTVEMAKLANLSIGNEAEIEEMRFGGLKAGAAELAAGTSMAGYLGAANNISAKLNEKDLSYANFGQKMYTKADLDRYYDTAINSEIVRKGYAPSGVGEVMRYSEGGGDLGAYYTEDKDTESKDLDQKMMKAGREIVNLLKENIPEDKITPEDQNISSALSMFGGFGLQNGAVRGLFKSPAEIKKTHKEVSDMMKQLNGYYVNRLGRDARFNMPIMNYLSLCERVLHYLDNVYTNQVGKDMKGDMGSQRANFLNGKQEGISYTGEDGKKTETKMDGALYEGYLMAGCSPEDAIKSHKRFLELEKIPEDNRSKEQKKEFSKLDLLHKLAVDFASSNRGMLEKKEFTNKDVEYAFTKLPKMETNTNGKGGKVEGMALGPRSASKTYQGLILETIFKGFSEEKINEILDYNVQAEKTDAFLTEKANDKMNQFKDILDEFAKSQDTDVAEDMASNFIDLLQDAYLFPAYERLQMSIMEWDLITITLRRNSKFFNLLVKLFKEIITMKQANAA